MGHYIAKCFRNVKKNKAFCFSPENRLFRTYSTATTATDMAGMWNTALPPSDVPLNATG